MTSFFPDIFIENLSALDLEALRERGIKGLLVDIDNTLVKRSEPKPSAEAMRFLGIVKEKDFAIAIVSNNSRTRVTEFAAELGVIAVHRACKPLRRRLRFAAKQLGLRCGEVAMVGDQIFTDVCGGNRCGMFTVLVEPIVESETLTFKVKRYFEKIVLDRYEKSGRKR